MLARSEQAGGYVQGDIHVAVSIAELAVAVRPMLYVAHGLFAAMVASGAGELDDSAIIAPLRQINAWQGLQGAARSASDSRIHEAGLMLRPVCG